MIRDLRPARSRRFGCRALLAAGALLVCLALAPAAEAFVYWTNLNGTTVGRANLDGTGANQNFITGGNAPCGVAADASHVYWGNSGNGTIGRANVDGTGVDYNFITVANYCGVAVNSTHIFWTDAVANSIGRANLDGTGANPNFIVGAARPCGVAVSATHIYWANWNSDSIGRADLATGLNDNQSFVPSATDDPCGVAVNATHIYWGGRINSAVGRADLSGMNDNQNFIPMGSIPCGVAVNPTHVYWANHGSTTIGRANLNGTGSNQSLIGDGVNPCGVAVDDPAVTGVDPGDPPRVDPRTGCLNFRRGVRGRRLGPARLGRTRGRDRQLFRGAKLRSRRGIDRYCVTGGGAYRIGYPPLRFRRILPRGLARRVRGRSILLLTSSRRYRVRRIRRGNRVRTLKRRVRGLRRFKIGRNTWYVGRPRGSVRPTFQTRHGRVRAVGLVNRRTARGRRIKPMLRAWELPRPPGRRRRGR